MNGEAIWDAQPLWNLLSRAPDGLLDLSRAGREDQAFGRRAASKAKYPWSRKDRLAESCEAQSMGSYKSGLKGGSFRVADHPPGTGIKHPLGSSR